jgi:hypothetical protein
MVAENQESLPAFVKKLQDKKAILDTRGTGCRGNNSLLRAWQCGGDTRNGQRNGDSTKITGEIFISCPSK